MSTADFLARGGTVTGGSSAASVNGWECECTHHAEADSWIRYIRFLHGARRG